MASQPRQTQLIVSYIIYEQPIWTYVAFAVVFPITCQKVIAEPLFQGFARLQLGDNIL